MQRASSDPAPLVSQRSLLGHTAEKTLQRHLCAFVEVIWDPAAPSRACELWPSTSQLGLHRTPHGTTRSLCAMTHRPYRPGFPFSLVCRAPIISDNERELTACEQEQITRTRPEKKNNRSVTREPLAQGEGLSCTTQLCPERGLNVLLRALQAIQLCEYGTPPDLISPLSGLNKSAQAERCTDERCAR